MGNDKGITVPGGTVTGNLTVEGTTNLNKLNETGPLSIRGTSNEIFFQDNGQIRSYDNNHRILFRRSENKLELREYGDLVFSPGATVGAETAKSVMLANGNVGIGTSAPTARLEVNGVVKATNFHGKFSGDGGQLYGTAGMAYSTVNLDDIDVRSSAVDVAHITIAPPTGRGYVIVRFNGMCYGSAGDRIVLACSNASKQWAPKSGSVSVLFNQYRGTDANVCHTMTYFIPMEHTQAFSTYYAVAQNSGESGGTGRVSIYGTFTVELYRIDYADF
ncbi:hypothetical protein GMSM_27360 [Geomonas sp. Red276]